MNAKKISLKLGDLNELSEFSELPGILKWALKELSFGAVVLSWSRVQCKDRLFVFNLFNTYNSLFWIAFVERNMEQLRVQVFFLLLSSIFINNMLPGSIFCL